MKTLIRSTVLIFLAMTIQLSFAQTPITDVYLDGAILRSKPGKTGAAEALLLHKRKDKYKVLHRKGNWVYVAARVNGKVMKGWTYAGNLVAVSKYKKPASNKALAAGKPADGGTAPIVTASSPTETEPTPNIENQPTAQENNPPASHVDNDAAAPNQQVAVKTIQHNDAPPLPDASNDPQPTGIAAEGTSNPLGSDFANDASPSDHPVEPAVEPTRGRSFNLPEVQAASQVTDTGPASSNGPASSAPAPAIDASAVAPTRGRSFNLPVVQAASQVSDTGPASSNGPASSATPAFHQAY